MLRKRIIPTLLIEEQSLVKSINFKNRTYVGDPLNAIKIFNEKFVDELIILDIDCNKSNYEIQYDFLKNLFSECFVPVTYGGGIENIKQAEKIFKMGAEKISLNSIVLENINIVKEFSNNFGSQSVVISIDVKKNIFNNYLIYNNKSKKIIKDLNLKEFVIKLKDLGAGEILINSVDNDGMMKGMDLKLVNLTKDLVEIPIVHGGGVGSEKDIKDALSMGISGVTAGSYFIFYGPHKAVLITYPFEKFENL